VAKAGDVIENPDTRERITFLKTTQETNGELLRFEDALPPGSPYSNISILTRRSATRSSRARSGAAWEDRSETTQQARGW
jgi:hypothetical protein